MMKINPRNELEMLEGNIRRLYVTYDEKELEKMREHAMRRINNIYEYRKAEFKAKPRQQAF